MRALAALAFLAIVPGCGMRYYAQPSTSEPHARVVIRFDHSARADTGPLDEFIWIDGDPIELRVDDDHALRVRVVPGPTRYHEEAYVIQRRTDHYQGGHYRYSSSSYHPVVEHVGDAGCTTRFDQSMRDGETYLFTYRYVSPEECSVTCHLANGAACDGLLEGPPVDR
jgi:hypothetical protein